MGGCSPPPFGLATGKPLALLCPRGWLEREEGAGQSGDWLRRGAHFHLRSPAAASDSRALGNSAAAAAAAVFLRDWRGLGRRTDFSSPRLSSPSLSRRRAWRSYECQQRKCLL